LTAAAHLAQRRHASANAFLRFRSKCALLYYHDVSQMVVGLLIGLSFVANVQLDPAETDPHLTRVFSDVDIVFTVLFV